MTILRMFCNGTLVGVRLVGRCIAFSIPLHYNGILNAMQRGANEPPPTLSRGRIWSRNKLKSLYNTDTQIFTKTVKYGDIFARRILFWNKTNYGERFVKIVPSFCCVCR